MDVGHEIELDITGVAHGVFVGRHEGRVVFVPDTLPGERVRVRLTDTKKSSFWRGEVVEVLDASPDRRPHVWPQADLSRPAELRPGGADFGHIALERQRALKLDVLRDALGRIGRLELPTTIEAAHPVRATDGTVLAEESADGTGWRTRVSLHVDEEGRVGPYAARSHTVVPVTELPLATDALSVATMLQQGGQRWQICHYLSLGGVSVKQKSDELPLALSQYLHDHPEIQSIRLMLDNDEAGRAAAQRILAKFGNQYDFKAVFPRRGKDFNEELMAFKDARKEVRPEQVR